MTTEQQTQEPKVEPQSGGDVATPSSAGEPKDDGKDALRRALAKQAEDHRSELAALQSKIEEFNKEKEAAAKAKMEEQGKFKELAQQADERAKQLEAQISELQEKSKSEIERLEKDNQRKLKVADLKTALVNAGARDQITLAGLMSMVPDEFEIAEYVDQTKKDHPEAFKTLPVSGTPPQTGRPGGSPTTEWEQINKDFHTWDPKISQPAIRKYEAYCREHNVEPPGTWGRQR